MKSNLFQIHLPNFNYIFMNPKTKKQFYKQKKAKTENKVEDKIEDKSEQKNKPENNLENNLESSQNQNLAQKSTENSTKNSKNEMNFGLKKIENHQNQNLNNLNKELPNEILNKNPEKVENKITKIPPVPLIKLENLEKYYTVGTEKQMVIKGISLEIFAGETVAILGKSGSGKSTLLNILGLLDSPTAGNYFLNGYDIKTLSGDFLATTRANTFGFIFQQFNLLPKLSVIENVIMPIRYTRDADKWAKRYQTANELLEMVEIKEQAGKLPKLLSGGQQQRVAIARSLVNSPKVIIGDEPTGALDSRTATQIVKQIFELNATLGVTVIIVTHDEDLAYQCSRVIRLVDGLIVDENTPLEN